MTKQELIDHFQEQKKVIEKEIAFWQAQPDDEPEKPKLRHGDFGINEESNPRISLFSIGTDGGNREDYCLFGRCTNSDYPILGNIFDLLTEWSEPFVRYVKKCRGGNTLVISHSSYAPDGIEFRINEGGCYVTASIPESEEIWRKLGQLIMTPKRKENKCS